MVYFSEIVFKFSSPVKEEENVYIFCGSIVLDWGSRWPEGYREGCVSAFLAGPVQPLKQVADFWPTLVRKVAKN